jgi:ferrous iron transport protein B
LIFATSILVWALGYFPADHARLHQLEGNMEQLTAQVDELKVAGKTDGLPELEGKLEGFVSERNKLGGELIEASYLGQVGHAIEPVVRPLGWDWKIGVGVLASFPAREVIIATLGTIYSLGADVDESNEGLMETLRNAKHADGVTPVFNVVTACSIMVFFALCAQCTSTLMVMRRETNSWKWPAITFAYMTTLAYVGALLTYQIGMLLLKT